MLYVKKRAYRLSKRSGELTMLELRQQHPEFFRAEKSKASAAGKFYPPVEETIS